MPTDTAPTAETGRTTDTIPPTTNADPTVDTAPTTNTTNAAATENVTLSSAPTSPTIPSKRETEPTDEDVSRGPPPLPYNLREHKLMIFLFWMLILTECTLIPIIFYFCINYLTDMRPGAMFAIITAMFGFISGGEYGLRGLRLALKKDTYRPLFGAGRWNFDTVHLVLGQPYFVMTALMIGFSIPDPPIMRGLSIIMPVGILMVTIYMMWTGIAHHFGWHLRYHRLSSHVVGDVYPPLTFPIMEDITACDGGGGKEYREAALKRYKASPRFRRMLVEMLWGWAITGSVLSIVLIALAWTLPVEIAYTLGWAVPSVWGGIGAFVTIKWGQRSIRIENEMWEKDHKIGA
ncbi:uncharacterized protein B0J16DRAFT_272559 [Fusarium flagelliforme]|uniref:uncharacterized protein n=1 Tax=Fusarium flagelliforme TaxID=2675880 RepID=UPI001E8DFE22|nr:uncharacterized protein B0J16DRAFT_272559 [Fusarium flagelliforme]KAH7179908.1 hypothetical protein B0J16DRAFT_272559 [Fusarium flagelliforme]